MTADIVGSGANLDSLQVYYATGDSSAILSELGYTATELAAIDYELDSLATELENKYPELEDLVDESPPACGLGACPERDEFFNEFSTYTGYTSDHTYGMMLAQIQNGGDPPPSEEGCEWGPYFAALIVCVKTGPVIYWPCAYVAMCSFCWGPTIDDICI